MGLPCRGTVIGNPAVNVIQIKKLLPPMFNRGSIKAVGVSHPEPGGQCNGRIIVSIGRESNNSLVLGVDHGEGFSA